jgi:hypothetical protein
VIKRWALPVLLVTMLATLALVGPASATNFTTSGTTSGGETVVVACPEGERFSSGTIAFYRNDQNTRKPLAQVELVATADGLGGQATAPKGARFYFASVSCEPIPPETVAIGESGNVIVPGESVTYSCPTGYTLEPTSVVVEPADWLGVNIDETSFTVDNSTGYPVEATVSATCTLA